MADRSRIQQLAVPAVCLLIGFLSYGSQALFYRIDPGPLTSQQRLRFNVLVVGIWISYARAVITSPGQVPKEWIPHTAEGSGEYEHNIRQRHCRKCEALKPPRAHHCKICKTCIPKMDHHCPWTANCVSHYTFPHFMRFLFYAVASMSYLEYFLYVRAAVIWASRDLRYDLGPSIPQLIMLFMLVSTNSLTLFMVGITFFRAFYGLCCNVSTIESWEIERHEQLLRRARVLGGFLEGPDGSRIRISRQEFPFDIGILRNISAGMGTNNPLAWLLPIARTPSTDGFSFDTNGFEDPGTSWPPPDPDRMPRSQRADDAMQTFNLQHSGLTNEQEIEAFRYRQVQDYHQRHNNEPIQRRKRFHVRYGSNTTSRSDSLTGEDNDVSETESGEEGWQDSGGNRLKDYGVDEDVEFYDEDDMPLAELLRKRRMNSSLA